jgi:hypothetical protein
VVLTFLIIAACSVPDSGYVLTLARLHNLKVAMSHASQLSLSSNMDFPKDAAGIIDFMEEMDGVGGKNRSGQEALVDGWGNEMRFEGDLNSYSVRSAGPDEIFDTSDDIYLVGNPDTEYVIDGVKESMSSGKDLMKTTVRVPFQEPNGYYRVVMPGRYSPISKQDGWRSEITFRYTADNTVTIVAEPGSGLWDPGKMMKRRINDIKSGMDESLWDYKVADENMVTVDHAPGYEVFLENEGALARVYGVRSAEGIVYSIVIRATGEDRQLIMDTLTETIQTDLDLR